MSTPLDSLMGYGSPDSLWAGTPTVTPPPDPFGIASLYAPAGQPVSPSILAGFNSPTSVANLYGDALGGGGGGGGIISGAKNFFGGFAPGASEGAPALFQAGLLRTLGPTAAGLTAANLVHGISPLAKSSAPEGALEGALAGAGVGASVGMMGGPFSEITVPGGALAGALLGGGVNALNNYFGSDQPKGPTFGTDDRSARGDDLISLMSEAGLNPNQQDALLKSFNVAWKVAPDDATRQQVYQNAQSYIASKVSATSQQTSLSPEQILATQALATSVMQPYSDRIQQQGATSAQMFDQLAQAAPSPAIATLARSMGATRAEDATRLAAAYQQQALALPALNALQLANQYGQQAFAHATAPSSSSSSNIASLIQQAQQAQAIGQ